MAAERVGGIIEVKVNGDQYRAKGNWTYNLGRNKREGVTGADAVHGYTEKIQIPFIAGEITDSSQLSLATLADTTDSTVTLTLANGKVIVLRNAWWAAEGTGNTDEGNIEARFEGLAAEEVQ